MPRPLRLSMFFDDQITGWSESHYDMTSPSLSSAVQKAVLGLVINRIQLLANGPWLKYVRASYDDTFRDSQVFFVPQPTISAITGSYINNQDWKGTEGAEPWSVALLRGVGGDLYRKAIYISGLPTADFPDVGSPFSDPTFMAAFQLYRNALIQGYGFPVWRKDQQTYPLKTIVAIQNLVPGTPQQLNIPGHGVPNPPPVGSRGFLQKMHYSGPSKIKLNGPYAIQQVIDANNLVLAGFVFPAGFTFTSGFFQYQTRDVVQYQDVLVERFTHRKRGRPFDSPRGRSRRATTTRAF